MQIDWFTFIAQVINFLILILLLQRFLYKPVIKAMDEREKKIASELEDARLKKVEADQRKEELDGKLQDFEEQKNRLLEDARQDINEQRKQWMDELRAEISEIRSRWEEAVEGEKETFLKQLKEETGDQVIHLVQNVLTDLSERNLQQQTMENFLDRLAHLDKDNRAQLQKNLRELKGNQADIYSSFDPEDQQKQKLKELLQKITNTELECAFNTTKDLGFGLEVRIGGWRLGWNLDSYLERLSRNMDQYFKDRLPERQTSGTK